MGIAAEIRHKQILGQLASTGRIYVKDISQAFGITEVTVRRDMSFLERKGLLKKTYGGAVLSAPEVVFVGDHTKFDNPALYKIADIDRLDYIVTDTCPAEAWHIAAMNNNIRLIYPKVIESK